MSPLFLPLIRISIWIEDAFKIRPRNLDRLLFPIPYQILVGFRNLVALIVWLNRYDEGPRVVAVHVFEVECILEVGSVNDLRIH